MKASPKTTLIIILINHIDDSSNSSNAGSYRNASKKEILKIFINTLSECGFCSGS